MKKNSRLDTRGFLLMETLFVSLAVAGILVYMYVQFSTIGTSYEQLYRFNTVDGVYRVGTLKRYIAKDANASFYSTLDNGNVLTITSDSSYFTTTTWKSNLYNSLDLSKVYVVKMQKDVDVRDKIANTDNTFRAFLNSVTLPEFSETGSTYLLVVKYNDGTYASITFTKE